MKTSTVLVTPDSKRIAKRLSNHWKHKFEVNESIIQGNTRFTISMPDAMIMLDAESDQLNVQLDTEREDYKVLENVIIEHLNRMAHQEFIVEWQKSKE